MSLSLNFPTSHRIFKKAYVSCHYIFTAHVTCHQALCRKTNLRNAHVARAILGVNGHLSEAGTESGAGEAG